MTTIPIDADGAVRRSSLVARGVPVGALYRALADGELIRIGSGLFVPAASARPDHRQRLMIGEVDSSPDAVFSHVSAAVLHGLPMLRPHLGDVHLTVPSPSARLRGEFRCSHVEPLSRDEVVQVDDRWVTTLERTAVDVAATTSMGFAGALAVFDAALRMGAQPDVLAAIAGRRIGSAAVVRAALRHSSPCADGVGESWCRAQMLLDGLPRPRLKTPVCTLGGVVLAEPDMDWNGVVLAEFDGASRRQRVRVPGDSMISAVWRTILRDEELRRRGIRVLRFTWADLERHDVAAACRYALRRAGLVPTAQMPTGPMPTATARTA
ncbi:hypothetical protein [Gordonia crocea]|uniref:Transcriptional regulator, AbiEi antitoxin, Type IV TA system n=1 Tax=Gordonia crocea TaxID=589162 RepID=A0A7I9UWK0_9ACTN|nr:hypothetical protein [Gordonia crocea]GED97359.1 hypothetical protein nbrc107697_13980 [Gordonia crocea]